jgi:hypothetical protein
MEKQPMNPFKSVFDRRSHRASRSSLRFESLEQRLPLAGNVMAKLVGSTLRLTGDSMGNGVVVASAAGGKIAVISPDTTINGSSGAFLTNKPVTSIIANLNGGDDTIVFSNSAEIYAEARVFIDSLRNGFADSPAEAPFDVAALQTAIDKVAAGVTTFSIPGSLTVTTAEGDDAVGIGGNVRGSVNVNLGSADNSNGLFIGANRIGGAVTVVGGRSNDFVALGGTVAGRVSADLGEGLNWMIVGGDATDPTIIGSLAYTGGANDDTFSIAGKVTVRNDVRINTGLQGEDSVGFFTSEDGSAVNVLGNVVVNTGTGSDGDTVTLVGEIRGAVSVTTGSGQDTVSVSSSVGWITSDGSTPVPVVEFAGRLAVGLDLTINTGAGNDLITIGGSTVGRNATIDAGSGNDDVRIDTMQVRRGLFVRLGAGDDALKITNLTASAANFDGGSGTNVLSINNSPALNRRLRKYRFQPVRNV